MRKRILIIPLFIIGVLIGWRWIDGHYTVPIMMYHRVDEEGKDRADTISPERFRQHMEYLKVNGYQVIGLDELVQGIKSGRKFPHNTVVITFDDGYEDNYTTVFPLLKKYRILARIFLATSFIGGTRTLRSGAMLPMLTWDQIREMKSSGLVEFHPHTHTHPKLTTIPLSDARKEIEQSMQPGLGNFFAYPYGYYNADIVQLVRDLGFARAYTVRAGAVTADTDPLLIPRNSIDSCVTFSMFQGIIQRGRIR